MFRCVIAASLVFSRASASGQLSTSYESFLESHGEARTSDAVDYDARARIFSQRLEEINRHNADPHATWTMGLNRFADYTDEEYNLLLGYRSHLRGTASTGLVAANISTPASSSFLQVRSSLAGSVQWTTGRVRHINQGACGSCWATAATLVAEIWAFIMATKANNGIPVTVEPTSFEAMVDCTHNPLDCGGGGGVGGSGKLCNGCTSELGYEWSAKHGLFAQSAYRDGYLSRGGAQPATQCAGLPSGLAPNSKPLITHQGFVRLPSNKMQPLMAVLQNGPVVVSVDASLWGSYSGGVFNGCPPDSNTNHAVSLTGYGKDANRDMDFFSLTNSWGPSWGEDGTIRLERKENYWGNDYKPLDGVACKADYKNNEVWKVNGMCGMYSDMVYPSNVVYHGVAAAAAA